MNLEDLLEELSTITGVVVLCCETRSDGSILWACALDEDLANVATDPTPDGAVLACWRRFCEPNERERN